MRKLCILSAALCLLACRRQPVLRLTVERTQHGWAYRITRGGEPLIYQANIPAIPGYHPFRNEDDAARTGTLVLQKLERGVLPMLSLREIDSLKITR